MPHANPTFASSLRGLGLLMCVLAGDASAATCQWNAASGAWTVPANWTGCADTPGPSTRSPGPADIAVVGNGIAQLSLGQTVAELELAPGGVLSANMSSLPTVTVTQALRLAGGGTTSILGGSQMRIALAAGGTGTLSATTVMDQGSFLENSGTLALGSASGVALELRVASSLINHAGGTVTLAGGNSLLPLGPSSTVVNEAGATFTVNGNALIGEPVPTAGGPRITNQGQFNVNGPGTLTIGGGNGTTIFFQLGTLAVSNATFLCNSTANACQVNDSQGAITTPHQLLLAGGTVDCGGVLGSFPLNTTMRLSGSGSLLCRLQGVRGTIAPGNATPGATLAVAGDVQVNAEGGLEFDLGGTSAGQYDRLTVGGIFSTGSLVDDGRGRLRLTPAAGYVPALGDAVPVVGYASAQANGAFNRVESPAALDYATRFDPTALVAYTAPRLVLEPASVLEGNSGSTTMNIVLRLSQPSSQTVTVRLQPRSGTAMAGNPPAGDYSVADPQVISFSPGTVQRQVQVTVFGDTQVEAPEDMALELSRYDLAGAAFGNGVRGRQSAVGSILDDDFPPGTRYVLVGKATSSLGIRRYSSSGTYIDTWNTQQTAFGEPNSGMCFAPDGSVLATRFSQAIGGPILFSRNGAYRAVGFGAGAGVQFNSHESCVYDDAGNVYVGQAGFNNQATDAQVPVLKFNASGALLDTFVLPTGTRGTDWIDLSANNCTLYYTSEDTTVRRYNLCTRSALPDFATGLTAPYCYALRLRPNGELMVACQEAVHRLSAQGANLRTYTRQSIGETDAAGLFALNLDPDGTSFWTAGLNSGSVFRVDIESGAVLGSFNSGAGGVGGLAVYDELGESDVLLADGFESSASAVARAGAADSARATEPVPDAEPADPHYALPLRPQPPGRD